MIWVCVIFAALCVGFFVPESRENLAFIAVTFAGGLAVYWYVDDCAPRGHVKEAKMAA